jgi:hypothetical protein
MILGFTKHVWETNTTSFDTNLELWLGSILILGQYIAGTCLVYRLVRDWYYFKSLTIGIGIKLGTRHKSYQIGLVFDISVDTSLLPYIQTNNGPNQ